MFTEKGKVMSGYNKAIDAPKASANFQPRNITFKGQSRGVRFRPESSRCWYCGVVTQKCDQHKPDFHTRDHIIPYSKGGRGGANFVPACKWCNSRKGSLLLEEFRSRFAMLKNVPVEKVKFYGERRP
jgi:5-methylcytosine-specific restriction endonuclease McrA